MTNPLDLGDVFDIGVYEEIIEKVLQEPGVDGVIFGHTYTHDESIPSTQELIRATKASLKSAQERYAAEQKKYDVGLSTIFDLLQYQSDLATAESNYAQAVAAHNKSLSYLAKVKGTLLEENDLTL